jgi:hypothetical protein
MTDDDLTAALQACAAGLYPLEAAAGLIIAHGTWLTRDDFTCFIEHRTGTAAIDWEAAAAALETGGLPCSGGERRMLQLAASLAGQAPVILGDAITGIDDRNTRLLVQAILHASGQTPVPLSRRHAARGAAMPSMTLDAGDAAELAEMLSFLSQWLGRDPARLGASLEDFAGHPAYGTQHLRDDLDRFIFLLDGSDEEQFLTGDHDEPAEGETNGN